MEWTLGALSPGAEGAVTLTVQVIDSAADGTSILNTASLNSDDTVPVTSSATITVNRSPVLQLTKTADVGFAGPGEYVTFVLAFGNSGNQTAVDAVLEDPVPNNTTFFSATGNGQLEGDTVIWRAAELLAGASGSVSLTVRVNADAVLNTSAASGTIIHNIATIDSSNAYAASAEDTVVVQEYPILTLEKIADVAVTGQTSLTSSWKRHS